MVAIEDAAKIVLAELPVTPITAVGINFAYVEDNPWVDLAGLFEIRDNSKVSDQELEINSTSIIRELKFEDRVMNFRLKQASNVTFGFNFHKSVTTAAQAREALDGKLTPFRRNSEEFLAKLYGLELRIGGRTWKLGILRLIEVSVENR